MPKTKKRAVIPPKAFADSASLWRALQRYGDIEPAARDIEFIPAIRRHLSLPATGSFRHQLHTGRVSVERLVAAVFAVTAPYGRMLSDLMVLFERARARASEDNISVVFNFDAEHEPLAFDLRSFRHLQAMLTPSTDAIERLAWNHDSARAICRLVTAAAPADVAALPDSVTGWLDQYYSKRTWPTQAPAPIIFGSGRLNGATRELWLLWAGVVSASRTVGTARRTLERTRFAPTIIGNAMGAPSRPHPLFGEPWLLANLDREDWAGTLLRSLATLSVSPDAWPAAEQTLASFVEGLPRTQADVTSQVQSLVDVLNLPIWQRRSELYSAWAGATIVAALGEDVRVHTAGNTLVFSFAGTHLATARFSGANVHVWAELRSRWTSEGAPRSKKRTKAIQPDYTITLEPITDAGSSVLVVEVKHYLKPSGSNFASALQDYAIGRPKAHVLLVDYGKANARILGDVAPTVRKRCGLIEECHPGNEPAVTQFSRMVRETARAAFARLAPSPAQTTVPVASIAPPAATGAVNQANLSLAASTIELRWKREPADLDLHVWVVRGGEVSYVSFRERTASGHGITAELDGDCRTAPGRERLWLNQLPEYVRCAVHNYSGQPSLSDAEARVTLTIGGYELECVAPLVGDGHWWIAFEFWRDSGRVITSNTLVEAIPDLNGVSSESQRGPK
jgi:hypothetical protein